jgi:hypothetical protein
LLTVTGVALGPEVDLVVPVAALSKIESGHAPDELANICALHVKGHSGGVKIADVTLIVDVFLDKEARVQRRLYGALPGIDHAHSADYADDNGDSDYE